ncbi:MAG: YceD family protein [Woeseiaceae bacterium]
MESNRGSLTGLNQESDRFLSVRFDSSALCPYDARAMGNPLQERRTPQEFAANGQLIEISSKIGDFEQLAAVVTADLGALDPDKIPSGWRDRDVAGQLGFGFVDADGKVAALEGQVTATIDAVCQRCLLPLVMSLTAQLQFVFGSENAIEKDGEEYEVWEFDGDELCPAELVEEALIMAIPFVAMHDGDANCVATEAPRETEVKMTMPFANLKAQMKQEN